MELCLGTVQFGMDYGIQGRGKPKKEEVFQILEQAHKLSIPYLDTANGYGEAETLIGEYLGQKGNPFHIITKLPYTSYQEIPSSEYKNVTKEVMKESLFKLQIDKLYGVLLHNPEYLYKDAALDALRELKACGITDKIGVSVYEPGDAFYALKQKLDIIQIPCNLFDRRFDNFLNCQVGEAQVFVRSVFLQGLLLMDEAEVEQKLPHALETIHEFKGLCEKYHYTGREAALSYVKSKKGIHSIIIGVDNLMQLNENVNAYQMSIEPVVLEEIASKFVNVREDIISPLKWRKSSI